VEVKDIPEALTGDKLLEAIKSSKDQRTPLVDGLLYDKTILMVAAPAGVGKSTISTQIAIEMAAGLPVFGGFKTTRPLKVLYCQTERPILEFLERAEVVSRTHPIVKENLVVTDSYKILNMLKEEHVATIIKCILRDCPNPDIIFFDPIYPMVSGGLSKDEPASAFCRAMSLIQKYTGASLYLNHHTVKPTQDRDGFVVEKDDAFYGSVWLKALVTGSYNIKETKDKTGVTLSRKKDNYNCLHRTIKLEYDPSTELCHILTDGLDPQDKYQNFLSSKQVDMKEFTFNEVLAETGFSSRYLRGLLLKKEFTSLFNVMKSGKNKNIYRTKEGGLC
jgi:RecA-family ATPase